MAAGVNNLTLVLNVADKGLRQGLKKAQSDLELFAKRVQKTFGARNTKSIKSYSASVNSLSASIKRLRKEISKTNAGVLAKELAGVGKGARSAQKGLGGVAGTAGAASRATNKLSGSAQRASLSLSTMRKSTARTAESIRSTMLNTTYLVTALVGGAATIRAVKFGAEFEKRLGEIDTLLDSNTVNIKRYQDQLIELSKASPKTLMDLSGALYQIISAGIPAVEGAGGAFDILNKSQKLAVGSISETKAAADLLITTMSAFEGQNIGAAEAADKLTAIYQKGRTTIPQLARAFGRAAPIASQFGVSLDELGGLMISLTRAGLNTNESVTGVRALMSSLAKPTKKTSKLLAELNIEFGEAAIQQKGFSGVLDDLIQKTGGSVDVLAKLFPNIRALLPAVIAAGQGFGGFSTNVDSVTKSIGAADQAVLKQQGRFFYAAELLKSNFQGVIQEIAQKSLPALTVQLSRLSRFISENREAIVSFGTSALKAFSTVGSVGFQAFVSLTKSLVELLEIFTSLPGAILLATAAMLKFGIAATASLTSGAGMVAHMFNPAKWTAAGAKAGAAASSAAGASASAGAATVGASMGSRLMTGLRGVLRFGGVFAIGGMLAQAIWAGYKEASEKEERKARERQLRFIEQSIATSAAALKKEFREVQGVGVNEVPSVTRKLERGTLVKEEGENLGSARTLKADFEKRLQEQTRIEKKAATESMMAELNVSELSVAQRLKLEEEFTKKSSEIRGRVLKETVEHYQGIVKASREALKTQGDDLLADQKKQIGVLNAELEKVNKSISIGSMSALGGVFSNEIRGAALSDLNLLEKRITQIKSAFAPGADTSFFDEKANEIRVLARQFDTANKALTSGDKDAAKVVTEKTEQLLATTKSVGESFPALSEKFISFAVAASNGLEKTDGAVEQAIKDLGGLGELARSILPDIKDLGINPIDQGALTRAADLNNQLTLVRATTDALDGKNFEGFFSTSYWSRLTEGAAGLAAQVRNVAFPDVIQNQIDKLLTAESARAKVKKLGSGKGPKKRTRAPTKANFESILDQATAIRLRLLDKYRNAELKVGDEIFKQRERLNKAIVSQLEMTKGLNPSQVLAVTNKQLKILEDAELESIERRSQRKTESINNAIKKEQDALDQNNKKIDDRLRKQMSKDDANSAKNIELRKRIDEQRWTAQRNAEILERKRRKLIAEQEKLSAIKQDELEISFVEKRAAAELKFIADANKALSESILSNEKLRIESAKRFQSISKVISSEGAAREIKQMGDGIVRSIDLITSAIKEQERALESLREDEDTASGIKGVEAAKARLKIEQEISELKRKQNILFETDSTLSDLRKMMRGSGSLLSSGATKTVDAKAGSLSEEFSRMMKDSPEFSAIFGSLSAEDKSEFGRRTGLSDDPEAVKSFARRATTGSSVDLGEGLEEEMKIIGAAEGFITSPAVTEQLKKVGLDGVANILSTPFLMEQLDKAGLGGMVGELRDAFLVDGPKQLISQSLDAVSSLASGDSSAMMGVATNFGKTAASSVSEGLASSARMLGSKIGSSVGMFAGETFGRTVGPILESTISFVAENVLNPIASTLSSSFGVMTGGISAGFSGIASEDRLFSSTQTAQADARSGLRSSSGEIRSAASDRVSELDSQIASSSDSQQRQDLIVQRREVLASMEEQLLEARTSFAQSERERVEEHRKNNPVLKVDEAFSKALEMADKVAIDLPIIAVKVIDGLIENFPVLLDKMASGFADTVSSIAKKIPGLMLAVVSGLIDAIPKFAGALTEMVPALIDGVLKSLIEIMSRFGEIIGPLVNGAVTAVIESFILLVDQIPQIAVALIKGVIQAVSVLAQNAPRIISALISAVPGLTFALVAAIPEIIAEIIKGIPQIIVGFGMGLKQAAIDFGKMLSRIVNNFLNVGGNTKGAKIGGGLGTVAGIGTAVALSATGPIGLALGALAGGGLGGLVGSFFHDGGMVGSGDRNPATAAIMRGLGSAQYANGGMVEMMNQSLSSNPLSSMRRAIDDVPAVLQAGEAVLNRRATAVLGEETINQLNAGGVFQGGDTSVTLNIQPSPTGIKSAAAALLPMLIGGVNAEVTRPGSKIRSAINSSSGRPIGSMSVPVSKRSTS